MAVILEQDKINELVRLQLELDAKQELAKTAVQKLEQMYKETTGSVYYFPIITLADVGAYIDALAIEIEQDSPYIDDFVRLRISYTKKIKEK
jgi:hypothetical protein